MAARTRKAPSAPRPADPVVWRDGVHITGTQIWCDARRARDVCFVSASDRVPARRHGQVLATPATLALMRAAKRTTGAGELPIPYGRPFTLGTHRLELLRSGHAFGSASLLVEMGGTRVLYAGAVCPDGGPLAGTADSRRADTLIVAARYGNDVGAFVPADQALSKLESLATKVTKRGGALIVFVDFAEKALEVLASFDPVRHLLVADNTIAALARAAQALAPTVAVPKLARISIPAGSVVLWPLAKRAAAALTTVPEGTKTVLLSGLAALPKAKKVTGVDHLIPFASHASLDELEAYVAATGAQRVFVTDHGAEAVAARLTGPKRLVTALGPPRQLSLFDPL